VGTTEELPTVISFCSGYAGIERGLDLAGIRHRVIAYVEIEAFAIANLVSKMESGQLDPAPIYTDLKTFPGHLFRGAVDIITGGYPCQPFSAAGKRLGEKDPRHLWPYIRKHIRTIQPARVFLENVEGHISMGLSSVISDLEEDGYRSTWGIFSAREVGAPHQRKRVYILADREGQFIECGKSERASAGQPEKEAGDRGSVVADSISLRHRWGNSDGCEEKRQKVLSGEQGRSEVGSEVEGRSKCGGDMGYSKHDGLQGSSVARNFICEEQKSNDQLFTRCNTTQVGSWPPEPGVGRVVDGCADRVDRIRLLGNGVVPQTAAKAWAELSNRMR